MFLFNARVDIIYVTQINFINLAVRL